MTTEDWKNIHEIGTELVHSIQSVSPKVWDITAQVVRVNAIQDLVLGVVLFLIGLPFFGLAISTALRKDLDMDNGWQMLKLWGAGTLGVGLVISSLDCLFNVWDWVSIFNPSLGLAHQLVSKVLGN